MHLYFQNQAETLTDDQAQKQTIIRPHQMKFIYWQCGQTQINRLPVKQQFYQTGPADGIFREDCLNAKNCKIFASENFSKIYFSHDFELFIPFIKTTVT